MNIVAIVQARMGSARLPGKVLKKIVGKPALWHLVTRLKEARLINKVVIAAPDNDVNQPIVSFARQHNIDYYAGSELDLLDRVYQAAKKFEADVIVLVTADCPLMDPVVTDTIVKYYLDNRDKYDCVSPAAPLQKCRPYPDGLGAVVFSFPTLAKMWQEVTDPFRREWFAASFFEQPEKYRCGTLPCKEDLSHMRWTLDYEDDLKFITEIYKRLYREDRIFLMEDILHLLSQHPELAEINKGHITNEAYIKALEARKGEGNVSFFS